MRLTPQKIQKFRQVVWEHYKKHGRDLPWRRTKDPYHILVSEIMLQQTQVDRVIPKYELFLKKFPTLQHLHKASVANILKTWQGLGYNRRALVLKNIAAQLQGRSIPRDTEQLEQLPGIGRYTAGAIAMFAYNRKGICLETNIRRVFLHHFFPNSANVSDERLIPYIQQTLPARNVRTWYWALMDYGAWLAKHVANPNRRSAQYHVQARFDGSVRQVRGHILKLLVAKSELSRKDLVRTFGRDVRMAPALAGLVRDGLIKETKQHIVLA